MSAVRQARTDSAGSRCCRRTAPAAQLSPRAAWRRMRQRGGIGGIGAPAGLLVDGPGRLPGGVGSLQALQRPRPLGLLSTAARPVPCQSTNDLCSCCPRL